MSLKHSSFLKSTSHSSRTPIPRLFFAVNLINVLSQSTCPFLSYCLHHNRLEWHRRLDFSMLVQKKDSEHQLFQDGQPYAGSVHFYLPSCEGNPDNISKLSRFAPVYPLGWTSSTCIRFHSRAKAISHQRSGRVIAGTHS